MQTQMLNGTLLHGMFQNGYRNLKRNVDIINNLNVFPVPDGDTGTNMAKTLGGGVRSAKGEENVDKYMKYLSQAVLMSARGNSGVIFSQFIHGIYVGLTDKETVSIADFSYAFKCAKEDAYRSVITPTEGTMLTVIRMAADFLEENYSDFNSFEECFKALIGQMKNTLAKTPDMLPVLKEAGVVDSGGAGLICIFDGMYEYLCGEEIEDSASFLENTSSDMPSIGNFGADSKLEYGYCTEFLLQLMNAKCDIDAFNINEFIPFLEALGNSIVAVQNGSIVKVHIHTFTPEKVLELGRRYGEFIALKIENMSVQHSETENTKEKEHLKYAIVAVASGDGIIDYFYSIGANFIINGGQTQNPSVDDFIAAFNSLDAEHIVVLPNNSNVVMTARQAAQMYDKTDIRVIPTKSVVEGYSALSMMNLWVDTVDELISDMISCLDNVTTGCVTTATRDCNIGGIDVTKGDYIGLDGETIIAAGKNLVDTAIALVHRVNEVCEKEVITVFVGNGVSEEDKNEFSNRIIEQYPLCEVGMINGKQDIYPFIISLE